MLKKLLFSFVFLALLSQPAFARVITFATDATWPPMEFVDANKQIVGFAIDYMTEAGKLAGFEPKFEAVAWDGIFAGLGTGKYDAICSSVSITEERKKAMDFSVPYFKVRQALVVPVEVAKDVHGLEDMKGKTLGAQISTTGHFAVKNAEGIKDKSYDEVGLAFEDMYNGRIDGVVCDDPVAANYALQTEKYKDKFVIAAVIETGDIEYYGVAVKKGDTEVLDLINKGIKAVQEKGIDKKLIEKWIGK